MSATNPLPPPDSKGFTVKEVTTINYRPHPYCITPKHLERNPHPMVIGHEQIEEMERKHGPMCGMYGDGSSRWRNSRTAKFPKRCDTPYDEHVSDKVAVIQTTQDCKQLKDIDGFLEWAEKVKPVMNEHGIQGFVFLKPETAK